MSLSIADQLAKDTIAIGYEVDISSTIQDNHAILKPHPKMGWHVESGFLKRTEDHSIQGTAYFIHSCCLIH
ncbi:unnamed protein product [Acanthoscelides obtectus]|uniref:Uncharacterized protein n=1 Tax=Acanthoscelides obtectus TaxID=200917 RepID=A0A9P0K8M1_ACAOB|nr:unnamed protein product [Acanthoscelides obtectus]CAK1677918.1 hypothetical protein AOBTE_LOCUS31648 [Acanthoscelides obtectus]